METSIMSVPYMDRGFELVVKEKIVAADLMAWAQVSVSVSVSVSVFVFLVSSVCTSGSSLPCASDPLFVAACHHVVITSSVSRTLLL